MLTNDMGKHLMIWLTMTLWEVFLKRGAIILLEISFYFIIAKTSTYLPMYEVQRGNCASILGTVESSKLLEELFDLFDTKSDHYHS